MAHREPPNPIKQLAEARLCMRGHFRQTEEGPYSYGLCSYGQNSHGPYKSWPI